MTKKLIKAMSKIAEKVPDEELRVWDGDSSDEEVKKYNDEKLLEKASSGTKAVTTQK